MKKILGVVLASALVAGAFAQVSSGVEFRSVLDVADVTFKKNADPTQSYLKQDNKDDTHIGISAAGKNVSATAEFNVDLNTMTLGVGDVFATFHVGGFNLTAGKLGSRFTNRMRQSVGKIINVSIAEPAKYGIAIKGNVGNDADNMTNGANLAMIGDYTFAIGESKLLAKAAIFDTTPGFPQLKSGYGFEAAFQSKLFTLDAVVKVPYANTAVTGVYLYIAPVKMLSVSAGGTLAWDNRSSTENFAFGIDARVRVVPIDALAVTLMGNYSNNAAKDSGGNTTNKDGMYVTLNGTYMLNDMFDLFCEAGYFDADVKGETNNNIKFQVGTTVKPVEHVTVSAAAQGVVPLYEGTQADGTASFQLVVPVALKVAF
ncbi:hypothetical protein HMPREF1221_01172 [Treponema socranskii subsp. paredis ATCC 35535]|nr:hypothetical protein HMPREF1221_01172 [Treponema socranskii subsp. paredis ATCC 35535]